MATGWKRGREGRRGAWRGAQRRKKNRLRLFEAHLTINLCSQLLLCAQNGTEKALNYVTYIHTHKTHGQLHRQRKSRERTNKFEASKTKHEQSQEMASRAVASTPAAARRHSRNNFAYESHTTLLIHRVYTSAHCAFHCIPSLDLIKSTYDVSNHRQ